MVAVKEEAGDKVRFILCTIHPEDEIFYSKMTKMMESEGLQ